MKDNNEAFYTSFAVNEVVCLGELKPGEMFILDDRQYVFIDETSSVGIHVDIDGKPSLGIYPTDFMAKDWQSLKVCRVSLRGMFTWEEIQKRRVEK